MKIEWFYDFRIRIALIALIVLGGFGILIGKLYFEQVRRGSDYRERISRQTLRRIRIPGMRGKIFTSDLQTLVNNQGGHAAVFYPEEMRRPGRNSRKRTILYMEQAAAASADAIGRLNPMDRKKIAYHLNCFPGLPITVFNELSTAESARILEQARRFNGIAIEPDNQRRYPMHRTACHILGFTGRENPLSALDRKEYFYYVPDLIGRSGLEQVFDSTLPLPGAEGICGLRGSAGFELVQVDSLGFIRSSNVDYAPAADGNHLRLTLDSRAQRLAEEAIAGQRGAFVVVDAGTGAVRAMASSPGFDPEDCSPRITRTTYRTLLHDPNRPMLPRAYAGSYTPGSILKVLMALAMLENGVDPDEKIDCPGYVQIGTGRIRCALHSGHGPLNMREAIEKSCNVYFMVQGMRLGREKMLPVLRNAGIGEKCGLPLPHTAGIFPDARQKEKRTGTPWNAFDTALLSMGQGFIAVSPLQAAMYTAAIANGGKLLRPMLVETVIDTRGKTLYRTAPRIRKRWQVKPEHLQIVREGMYRVVHSPEGSGRRAASPLVDISGKTGSAEVGPRDKRHKNVWFIAIAKLRGRTYASAMMLEYGRSGGLDCAPRTAEFFEKWSE